MVKDLTAMTRWFQTGRYVADPSRQRELFGQIPTPEDSIARLVGSLGHTATWAWPAARPSRCPLNGPLRARYVGGDDR